MEVTSFSIDLGSVRVGVRCFPNGRGSARVGGRGVVATAPGAWGDGRAGSAPPPPAEKWARQQPRDLLAACDRNFSQVPNALLESKLARP